MSKLEHESQDQFNPLEHEDEVELLGYIVCWVSTTSVFRLYKSNIKISMKAYKGVGATINSTNFFYVMVQID